MHQHRISTGSTITNIPHFDMLNYSPIPTKPMEIPMTVRITTGQPITIVSNSFFDNMPNINAQFNISHVAKQHNVTSIDLGKLIKLNESYGLLSEIVLAKFVQDRARYGMVTNAFFTRIEVLSICNILHPIQTGEASNNIMYIGDDFHSFTGVIAYMIPTRSIIFTPVAPSLLRVIGGIEQVLSLPTSKNVALIYVDVCAPEVVYSHTYVVFLLKTLAVILSSQSKRGTVVIKTNMLIFKPILDVLYLLSGKYEHMYIVRPFVSEDSDSRFVIFTGLLSVPPSTMIDNLTISANNVNTVAPNQIISSVIDCKMSQYFITKIEESNLLIGQKHVEKYDSLVTMIKTYAKDSRFEYAKNASIIRCIGWCEKHGIPTQPSSTSLPV
jgi:hypothetical protein